MLELMYFFAGWCAPCRAHRSAADTVFALMAEHGSDTQFIDVDEDPETTGVYHITALPTLLILKDGEVVQSLIGDQPQDDIARAIEAAA